MTTEVLFLAWNRLAFTKVSFQLLLQHTNWDRVRRLVVYDDGSTDGTREWLEEQLPHAGVDYLLRYSDTRSPPAIMNDYLWDAGDDIDVFAKVDNDIALPPGWLDALLDVLEANPDLELLGAEAGQPDSIYRPMPYSFEPCTHVGGIGAFRVQAFRRTMERMKEDGRFGFQEHQLIHHMTRGWLTPDIHVIALDRVPLEPFLSLSDMYVEQGWQRDWWRYEDDSRHVEWFKEGGWHEQVRP